MTHELKIWPQYYEAVADGTKTFEVRNNDRGFQKGDTVILRAWSPEPIINEHIVGYLDLPNITFKIGYVLPIDDKRVVFSLLKNDL